MTKLILLGTAASIPTSKRDNTSFIFIHKRELILVDCPGSIVYKLSKIGIDFAKLKNIIVTHQHPDHFYGIIHLIHAQTYLNREINLFSNKQTQNLLKTLIRVTKLNRPPCPKINFYDVFRKEFFYQSLHLKIKAIKTKHILSSFGVKFYFGKKRLLYSSDTALSKNVIEEARLCDYLIHDCTASSYYFKKHPQLYRMHTDSKSLAQALNLKGMGLKKIIPIHFLLLEKGEEERIKSELKPLKGKLLFPTDTTQLIL
jgi:ribonuclease BN (tRNA processing enzyme)